MHELIADPIRIAAKKRPDRIAIVCGDRTMTFSEFDYAIDNVSFFMEDRGIEPGDIVAILDRNSIPYAILFWAAYRFGAVLMPLNCQASKIEWRRQLELTKCRHLFYGDEFAAHASIGQQAYTLRGSYQAADPPVEKKNYQNLGNPAFVMFTSGSTGQPRGVRLTWGNIFYSATGANDVLAMSLDDVWFVTLPFFHIGGISILFRAALSGSGVHLFPRFAPEAILRAMQTTPPPVISVVPTMLNELLAADNNGSLARCRAIILGGAEMDDRLRADIASRRLPVLTTYGMTETASMVTLQPLVEAGKYLHSSGKVLPHRKISISSDGHILVRGKTLFTGYVSEKKRLQSGWFDTGDIGYIDGDGRLYVTGRSNRKIISGGENIDLHHIERELKKLSAIESAVVLSRPDSQWGERPVAFVVLNTTALSESDIKSQLRESIGSIYVPERVVIVQKMPLTGSGKIDRPSLRDAYKDVFEE